MKKPRDIVDREVEWTRLRTLWESPRPELAFVLGRRRVGKSYLLAPFARAVRGLYYQGSRRSEAEQLAALTSLIGAHFADPALQRGAALPGWDALLGYLKDRVGTEPFLLVLDEYPYLEEVAPGLSSLLQRWWDHELAGTRIKVLLAGSYVAAMKRLDDADQPLHTRRTARLALAPFDAFSAAAMYPAYSARDRILTHAIFGGLPGHLALVDDGSTVGENVVRHILDPSARLFDEAQQVLDGLRSEPALHHSILSAIAAGEHTWRGITKRTGKTSGSLSRPLSWLLDMELVRRVVPITERDPRTTKRVVYRLADPYLVFWHRFVAPLVHSGLTITARPESLLAKRILPGLDDHVGPIFEDVCRDFVARTEVLPFEVADVGTWWSDAEEIDVVARSLEGDLLAAECKWGTADRHDLARLRTAAAKLSADLGGTRSVQLALFTGRGLGDDETCSAVKRGEILHFDAEALFRRLPRGVTPRLPGPRGR